MVSYEILIQSLINGAFLGALYALIAYGLNVVWGVMNVVNAAHGHLIVLSAFASYWLWIRYGFDPLLSMIVSVPLLFVVGLFLFRLLVKPVFGTANLMGSSMLIFWGLALALENAMVWAWSVDPRSANAYYVGTSWRLGPVLLPITGLAGLLIAMAMLGILVMLLKRSFLGMAIRATAQDTTAAKLMGIDTTKVSLVTFALGSATAGVAGAVVSVIYIFYPSLAWQWLGRMFVVCVLGGLGDPIGAVIAGLVLGISESMVTAFTSATLAPLVAYVILILVLIFRPTGILGRK